MVKAQPETLVKLEINGSVFSITLEEAANLRCQISSILAAHGRLPPTPEGTEPRTSPLPPAPQWTPPLVPGDTVPPPYPLECGALWEVRPQDLPQYQAGSSPVGRSL